MITRIATVVTASVVAASVLAVSFGIAASAQSSTTLSSDMLETIRDRCTNSQFALQQIEKRDAVSRINRGRAYDQMLRQLFALNSRFAYNKISSPELIQITTDIQKAVDEFRAQYDRYDTDIADALKIDCRQKPADYYDIIIRAREDRNAVGAQVRKIEQLAKGYREAVVVHQEALK